MEAVEMTISDMVRAYNAKVELAINLGLQGYKPRRAFHHRTDALAHLEQLDSSIRAFESGQRAEERRDEQPAQQQTQEEQTVPTKKKSNGNGNGRSKTEIVAHLLKRSGGCTAKQVLEHTGWPSVSMPAMAKACGLKLVKDKQPGKPTRYYGE